MESSLFTKTKKKVKFTGLRAAGIVLFVLVVQLTVFSQTTIYIDPTYTGSTQNGTITNPYHLWSQATITSGNTYLQKRGTTYNMTGNIWVFQKSNVTLGAYGTGTKPRIISSGSGNKVVDFGNSQNCVVRDLNISSTGNALTGVYFAEGCANNLIDSCEIHNCEWGARITTTGGGNRILNSIIHTTGDDGVYIKDVPNIEIGYCHIYDVNRKWFINPDQSYSPGDCIQISSVNNLYYNIHHNILDHTSTGNKFCFISYGVNYSGLIEHNVIIGNASSTTSCIYFHATTGTVTVRNNTIQNGNYGIYSYVDDLQLSYNKIINNTYGIRVLTGHNLTALNNVFYGNTGYSISSLGSTVVTSRNNAFYLTGSSARIYITGGTLVSNFNNFNTEQASFINGHNTLASWNAASGNDLNSFVANPVFVNPAIEDFCLQTNSPCINSGVNVNLPFDYFGTAVPQASNPDIGLHEVITSQGNLAPVITNQSFGINENAANGSVVGTIVASDPNQGQSLTYSITAGNSGNAFVLNQSTGVLTVANSAALNFESTPVFQLTVQVQDNGTGNLTASATITVNLTNVNETPSMSGQTFTVNENTVAATQVGTMVATDPDQGQIITYSITAGNTNTAFAINAATGVISVSNPLALNFETQQSFALIIMAQDNGTPAINTTATAQITISNVNENPAVNNQDFAIASYSPNGTAVGIVMASDPDLNQTLSYSITAGNTATAFAINTSNGTITVANSAAVNYLINPQFSLTVSVQDNGSPVLASSATITITVTGVNSAPVISDQSFTAIENSLQGTVVGQVIASDPDPTQALSYSIISGNTGSTFQLSATGQILVANTQLLNFEAMQSFQLLVQVIDNGTPPLTSSANITISLSDVNENPLIPANQTFIATEHVSTGTQVGVVSASDPDAGQNLTYSIISGNTGNAFAISPSTGLITVSGNICFENCSQYSLLTRTSDNGSPSLLDEEIITINLADVNESPVISNQVFSSSSFASNGTFVGVVTGSDPDINQTLAFSIVSGNSNGAFALNTSDGTLTVANSAALDPAITPTFSLNVMLQDNGNPVLSSNAVITVNLDAQNSTPVINAQAFNLEENQVAGTLIGTIAATDPNSGQTLTYSIVSGNPYNTFAISETGILSVGNSAALDYETNPVFTFTVMVTDNGTPALSAQAPVTVSLTDVNDPPVMLPQALSAKENTPKGRYIGKINGSDQDYGDTFQFTISDGNTDDAFLLQPYTGRIFVNNSAALNYEVTPVFYLTVRSTDNHGAYSEQIMTINLINVNEAPVVQNQSFSVSQSATNGTEVGTVIATDPDFDQILKYSITKGNTNGIFAIDQFTGIITVANAAALGASNSNSFRLTVKVIDNGSPALYTNGFMTISIIRSKDAESPEATSTFEADRLNLSLKVYPNPSSDGIFNIKLIEEVSEPTIITITDLSGKVLVTENIGLGLTHRMNLGNLPSGIYLMHAKSAAKQSVTKLIRQ